MNKRPQRIIESGSALSKDVTVKSFKSCALNIASDGSEDDLIHCFEPNQPCHAGCQQVKLQWSVLDEGSRDNPLENMTKSNVDDAVDDLNLVDASDEETNIHIGM